MDEPIKGKGSYLRWWSIYEMDFPSLAKLARDIFVIPSMLVEVERLFSSAELMIPPYWSNLEPSSIEARECIRS
jgi:hypothetical protein